MSTIAAASFSPDGRRLATSFPVWPAPADVGRWLEAARIDFVSSAQWQWPEGHKVARRRLPTTTMGFHFSGTGTVRIAGVAQRIVSPCLQCVPAGVWHDVRHDPGQPFATVGVHLQAPLASGGELFETLGFPLVLALDLDGVDAPLVAAMHSLARLDAQRPPGWRLLAQAEVVSVIMHVVLTHGPAFRPVPAIAKALPRRLAPVMALIERELGAGPIRSEDLALAGDMSAAYLRTLFRRTTGHSPHRYVQGRRIALACRLLRSDDTPLGAIAEQVGVPDLRVFHRLFKHITGTTPGRWRAEM